MGCTTGWVGRSSQYLATAGGGGQRARVRVFECSSVRVCVCTCERASDRPELGGKEWARRAMGPGIGKRAPGLLPWLQRQARKERHGGRRGPIKRDVRKSPGEALVGWWALATAARYCPLSSACAICRLCAAYRRVNLAANHAKSETRARHRSPQPAPSALHQPPPSTHHCAMAPP